MTTSENLLFLASFGEFPSPSSCSRHLVACLEKYIFIALSLTSRRQQIAPENGHEKNEARIQQIKEIEHLCTKYLPESSLADHTGAFTACATCGGGRRLRIWEYKGQMLWNEDE